MTKFLSMRNINIYIKNFLTFGLFSIIFLCACGASKQNIVRNDSYSSKSYSASSQLFRQKKNTETLFAMIDAGMSTTTQVYDSLIVAIDGLLDEFKEDTANMRLAARHLYDTYLVSEMLGAENITIHIADNYYLNGRIRNEDPKFIEDVADYADKFGATIIGKKAENLKMETVTGTYEALYDIDSPYTLIYFFDPICRHCYLETPKIYKVFRKYKDKGLAGYCVYSQNNKEEWLGYLSKNKYFDWLNVWDPNNENDFRRKYSIYSIPQAYLLDRDKNIVGRRLDETSLTKLLDGLLNKK